MIEGLIPEDVCVCPGGFIYISWLKSMGAGDTICLMPLSSSPKIRTTRKINNQEAGGGGGEPIFETAGLARLSCGTDEDSRRYKKPKEDCGAALLAGGYGGGLVGQQPGCVLCTSLAPQILNRSH